MTVFIREFGKKASHALFGTFWKKLLQSVTESSTHLKVIVTKCDKKLLQSMTVITSWDRIYGKVWQVFQSVTRDY